MITYIGLFVMLLAFNGCNSTSNAYTNDGTTTLFLVDEQGFSYGGIPYKCDSDGYWKKTAPNGEFTFVQPDTCEFDFAGLEGDYNIHPGVDDVVRIVDYTVEGKPNIPYECVSFGASTTFGDGSFYYDIDDSCTFYL